jgi:hypothetical protein
LAFDFEGMVKCGLKHLGLTSGESGKLASVFSAELVCAALQKGDLLDKNVNPSDCTPKTLEMLDIFEPPQLLKLYKG